MLINKRALEWTRMEHLFSCYLIVIVVERPFRMSVLVYILSKKDRVTY